jgi:hypothetical protein
MPLHDPAVLDGLKRVTSWTTAFVLLTAGRGWYKGTIAWRSLISAFIVCAAVSWAHIATYYVPEPYLVS